MPQFCLLFQAILQSWRPKGGAWHNGPPLNTTLLLRHWFCPKGLLVRQLLIGTSRERVLPLFLFANFVR